jgi:predicted component of type VI protein secretion system
MSQVAAQKTLPLDKRLAWVVLQNGRMEGKVFSLVGDTVIGQGPNAQIQVTGDAGSSAHVTILNDGVHFWLLNHARDGFARVGATAIASGAKVKLSDGDVITVGSASVIFKSL